MQKHLGVYQIVSHGAFLTFIFLGANYERENITPGRRTQDDNGTPKRNCTLAFVNQVNEASSHDTRLQKNPEIKNKLNA